MFYLISIAFDVFLVEMPFFLNLSSSVFVILWQYLKTFSCLGFFLLFFVFFQNYQFFLLLADWAFFCECGTLWPQKQQEDFCRLPRGSEPHCCQADALRGSRGFGKWKQQHGHPKTIRRTSSQGVSRGMAEISKAGCTFVYSWCDGKCSSIVLTHTIHKMSNIPSKNFLKAVLKKNKWNFINIFHVVS